MAAPPTPEFEPTWWERPRFVMLSAMFVGVALTAADIAGGPGSNYSGLLLAMPLIASTAGRPVRTIRIGLLALTLGLVLFLVNDLTAAEMLVRGGGLAVGGGFAVGLSFARTRREQRLLDLNRFATLAQELILRPIPGRIGSVRLAGRYQAASDVLIVGGDLYDVASTPYGLRFVVGDAKGKGLDGVRMASSVLTAFRHAAFAFVELPELVADLDRCVAESDGAGARTDPDFVTAIVGQLTDDGLLMLANCGHLDGIVVGAAGTRPLECAGRTLPLGLGAEPNLAVHQLAPGDRVVFFTDGVTEARDATGRFLDDALLVHVADAAESIADLVDRVVDAAMTHVDGRMQDDLAVMGFEFSGIGRRPDRDARAVSSLALTDGVLGSNLDVDVDFDFDLALEGDVDAELDVSLDVEDLATAGR